MLAGSWGLVIGKGFVQLAGKGCVRESLSSTFSGPVLLIYVTQAPEEISDADYNVPISLKRLI